MPPSSVLPVLTFLLLYVPRHPLLSRLACAFASRSVPSLTSLYFLQYATALEDLAFPDTSVIVKVIRRSLYRS